MVGRLRLAIGIAATLAVAAGEARAQYYGGYGGWGWGGWGGGSTVQGSIASGLGRYAAGVGEGNLLDAQAASINEDTITRWNEFMFLSQQEANRREYARRARLQNRDSKDSQAIYERIRDNPTPADIDNGDALNVALSQITDPRIHSSALRMARDSVPSKAIAEIPFENASEGVTLSLHQLTAQDWPLLLQGPEFAEERENYRKVIADALKEDENGTISPETLQRINGAVSRIRAKLEPYRAKFKTPNTTPADRARFVEAENYVKALAGLDRMLEKPQTEKILAELKKVNDTTLGSLLGFMHTYNLRFGRATTPEQRAVYQQLYPMVDALRDKVAKETDSDGKPAEYKVSREHPSNFFSGMHLDHLEGKGSTNR
jgi:hypothetical protein